MHPPRCCRRYWIYAAVAAGESGLLVSNDEMRDHIFQLLAPKFFLKWKQRHQLKYRFGINGLQVGGRSRCLLGPRLSGCSWHCIAWWYEPHGRAGMPSDVRQGVQPGVLWCSHGGRPAIAQMGK